MDLPIIKNLERGKNMFTKNALRKSIFIIMTIILLTACVPQVVQTPSTTSKPISITVQPSVSVPSSVPMVNATRSQTPTLTSANTQGATFEGLSTGLDNTKLARIRTVSGVLGPNLDVYINGLPVVSGGKMQQSIDAGSFSGWVYVIPGTYQVTLVPNGKTVEQAIFTPVAVNAEAGHRYTVAAMGQVAEKNVKPLVIDETAIEAGLDPKATNDFYIFINNLKGADNLGLRHDGVMLSTTKYGEASAAVCPSYNQQFEEIMVAGNPDTVIASGNMYCHLGASAAVISYGDYPNNVNISNDSQGTSEANILDYLAENNQHPSKTDDGTPLTFNTLLAAIDKAGMRDMFTNGEPYFFIAPTDDAFAALPKDQLDALLNDPQQLTKLLKTGFISGYYPFGSLSGTTYGISDRVVTNSLGQDLSFQGETINGMGGLGPNITVGNGNRIQIIYNLLPYK